MRRLRMAPTVVALAVALAGITIPTRAADSSSSPQSAHEASRSVRNESGGGLRRLVELGAIDARVRGTSGGDDANRDISAIAVLEQKAIRRYLRA